MNKHKNPYQLETLIQHLGEESKIKRAVVPPLFQNSLFVFDSVEEFRMTSQRKLPSDHVYSRVSNPTLELLEQKLAALEGTERCKLVGSGMSAIAATILACVQSGSHVVTLDTAYGPVRDLLENYLPKFGVSHTLVDGTCEEEIFDAIQYNTTLVYLESPTSIVFRLQNLNAIAAHCKAKGIKTAIDNTYATPLYQNPAQYGIDYVIHSCTKYIGGHSDVVAGAVCCSEELLQPICAHEVAHITSALSPFNAWLLTRGLRTLPIRLKHHQESAQTVASWLEDQDWVRQVNHLGLPSFSQKALFQEQMQGSTGLFSFIPKIQTEEAIHSFVNELSIFGRGVSWGGFESLVVPVLVQASYLPEPTYFVRLFVGLESPIDLIHDLECAAKKAFC